MPDNNGSPTKILVYSWKPLWVYWPVYLALARTEKTLNVVFQLKTPEVAPLSGVLTDETIRAAFGHAQLNDRKTNPVALCEPGAIPGLNEDELYRVPVIWRMPHWLIATQATTDLETLWCYPEKTTSGDYARILQGAGLIHAEATFTLSEDQDSSFLMADRSKPVGSLTFTPSHLWNRELHSCRFPGPDRDITALIIPRADGYPLGEYLRDAIRGHFQRVLQALGTTHGDDRLVEEFVQEHQPAVKKFYSAERYPAPPKQLGMALAEYVRQGCYFPYNVVRSALIGELSSIANDALTLAKDIAQNRTTEQLAKLLGSMPDWSTLSFRQRQSVWTSGIDENGMELHERITHAKHAELQPLLTGTRVRLPDPDPNLLIPALSIRVSSLNANSRPLLCAASGDTRCLHKVTSGTSNVTDHDPCFGCTIGGLVMPVLRSAARDIARPLQRAVTYSTHLAGNDPQSVLCWEDVVKLVALFRDELREGPGDCHVALCPTPQGAICFSILWTGSTAAGSGQKRATRTIPSWAASHTQARRTVTTAGFFKGGKKYQSLYPDEREEEREFCTCHHTYSFGYVAFFDTGRGAS
jgi:hypothetical protein